MHQHSAFMLHRNKAWHNKVRCPYILVKVIHPKEDVTCYWIQYPVKFLGITLWMETTTEEPFTTEEAAFEHLEEMCCTTCYEMKTIVKEC